MSTATNPKTPPTSMTTATDPSTFHTSDQPNPSQPNNQPHMTTMASDTSRPLDLSLRLAQLRNPELRKPDNFAPSSQQPTTDLFSKLPQLTHLNKIGEIKLPPNLDAVSIHQPATLSDTPPASFEPKPLNSKNTQSEFPTTTPIEPHSVSFDTQAREVFDQGSTTTSTLPTTQTPGNQVVPTGGKLHKPSQPDQTEQYPQQPTPPSSKPTFPQLVTQFLPGKRASADHLNELLSLAM